MTETKKDEHGEYHPDAGSPHPVDPEDLSYTPCNAVLKYTFERYGERRYCTGMAESNFKDDGSQFCKHHKSREALMKQHEDNFKTGAYAKSHEHKFQYMPPHKKLLANDLYKSLLDESTYDFEAENVELDVDVADTDFAPDADTLVLDHPIPQEHEVRGKALWHAALDFMTMESIREEQFRVAAQESHEGRELAVGERVKTVTVTDEGREIEDTDEHHLNLPLSRLQKDYESHMAFGGVQYDSDGASDDMGAREWVAVVEPEDEPAPEPETTTDEQSPLADIEPPEPEGETDG